MKQVRKILYVSHRYHTNQIPIMKGWHESGFEVKFLAQYQGPSELHDFVDYHQIKPSVLFVLYIQILKLICKPNVVEKKYITNFIPSILDLYRQIKTFSPDLIIHRDYNRCNLFLSLVCKFIGIKNIINYTQIPLYGYTEKRRKEDIIASHLFTNVCFTPVKYRGGIPKQEVVGIRWCAPKYFVPLIASPSSNLNREYCKDQIVHLLDVGKYRDYKNHFFLVKAISEVRDICKFKLKIVGQVSQRDEQNYYNKLQRYVAELGLDKQIEVLTNIPYKEMMYLYDEADVLILASKKEIASIAIIEAMSKGLCVMSTINNGTACYLDNDCGFVFNTDNTAELVSQLNSISQNIDIVREKGIKAFNVIQKNYCFNNYLESLDALTKKEFDLRII